MIPNCYKHDGDDGDDDTDDDDTSDDNDDDDDDDDDDDLFSYWSKLIHVAYTHGNIKLMA